MQINNLQEKKCNINLTNDRARYLPSTGQSNSFLTTRCRAEKNVFVWYNVYRKVLEYNAMWKPCDHKPVGNQQEKKTKIVADKNFQLVLLFCLD